MFVNQTPRAKREAWGIFVKQSPRAKGSSSSNHHERSKKFKGSLSINQLCDGFAENQQKKSLSNILRKLLKKLQNRDWKFANFFAITFAERRNFEKSIFFKFDIRAFDILSLKSIETWQRSLIFIEILGAIFEKPKIFDFVRLLSRQRDEIEKVARLFSIKSVKRYLKWLRRNRCTKFWLT